MSSPALLDADASRPQSSGILTPSSESSSHRHHGRPSMENQDRKCGGSGAMEHMLRSPITIKPHPPKLHVQPRVMSPLMLLPRKHLPLSSIDFEATNKDSTYAPQCESHIKILDLESRMSSSPSILIARDDAKGTINAVERVENGIYTMCRLGAWVSLDALADKATVLMQERLCPSGLETRPDQESNALITPQTHKQHTKKRAAIEAIQSLVRKRPRSQSTSTNDDFRKLSGEQCSEGRFDNQAVEQAAQTQEQGSRTEPSQRGETRVEEPSGQQTSESILESIRTQYFEALYKSMGSLAYFAKGPLSRARSAFHLDLESNLDMSDLIEFLKSLILATVQIDKKYRETLPEAISKLSKVVGSSDEGKKSRKKPNKIKLGKNCLYSLEDDLIRTWWDATRDESEDSETENSAHYIKSHVSVLRTRETQLQMILILEILALEHLKTAEAPLEASLPTLPGADETDRAMAPPPPKKRSRHNLPVLVDVHADRLTIWQSTASDEQLLIEDSQSSCLPLDGGESQIRSSSEPLKDFCVDVIVPFFSARLPELCDAINRKLGGPVIVSPPKSTSQKPSSKRSQKPGTAAKRSAPSNTPRTLQRALSTEQHHRRSVSRGPSNMIALMRSASSTSLSTVKREGSEPAPLRTIPKGELNAVGRRQGSLSRSSSMTKLGDPKVSKKAHVEAELQDAISALRKPNREVVGKAMAEADERRATNNPSLKKKKLFRSSLGSSTHSIQVKATPTNQRFKDILPVKLDALADTPLISTEEIIPPSSGGSLVPSTIPRNSHRDAVLGTRSPAAGVIGTTPIRPSSRTNFLRRPAFEEPAIPPSSPLMQRNQRLRDEDFIPGSAIKTMERMHSQQHRTQNLLETPVKKSSVRIEPDVIVAGGPELLQKKTSIYERLGWDDDLDDF